MTTPDKKIGETIRNLLETRNINIDKLSELTGITPRFLEQLINENFSKLPPAPYIRGYILKIAEVLGAEGSELWEIFQQQNKQVKRSGGEDKLPTNRFEPKKINQKIILGVLFGLLLIGYLIFRYKDFSGTPILYIESPEDNVVVSENQILIKGRVNPQDTLTINAESVYVDKDGFFEKEFALQSGINNIEFSVKKFLGKEIKENRRVIYNVQ